MQKTVDTNYIKGRAHSLDKDSENYAVWSEVKYMKATATRKGICEHEASPEDAYSQRILLNINHEIFKSEMIDDTAAQIVDRLNKVWTFGGDC